MKAGAQRWTGEGGEEGQGWDGKGGTMRRDLRPISLTLLRALKRDFAF